MFSKFAVSLFVAASAVVTVARPFESRSSASNDALNVLASFRGRYVGTATESYDIDNNTAYGHEYGAIATSDQFGIYTPENSLKWDVTEPEQGVFNFTLGDALFDIAEKYGKRMRGHNLLWYSQNPDWLTNGNFTPAELKEILRVHIVTEVGHYKGRTYAWDVINEPWNDDGTWRSTIWFDALGEEVFTWALQWAHETDPDANLYINDYNMEEISNKTDAAYAFYQKLLANKVPIHGLGAESHLIVGELSSTYGANLQRFSDLGVDVALTELDIRFTLPATEALLEQQKADYRSAIDACLSAERCVGATLWEFTDAQSWVPATFPGQGDACPWSATFQKKPAFYGIVDAFEDDYYPQ